MPKHTAKKRTWSYLDILGVDCTQGGGSAALGTRVERSVTQAAVRPFVSLLLDCWAFACLILGRTRRSLSQATIITTKCMSFS
jgi:hypothetical protein